MTISVYHKGAILLQFHHFYTDCYLKQSFICVTLAIAFVKLYFC